jgi:uncharacterized protein YbjT (DUF2867 family)
MVAYNENRYFWTINKHPMILLIGASGLLGSSIGQTLQEKKIPFVAAGRNENKLLKAYKNPPPFRALDLFKPTNLETALDGIDKIIVSTHALFGTGKTDSSKLDRDGIIALINYAKTKNIANFILVSVHGAANKHPVDFYENKFFSETALVNSGIPYTILQPTAFMELHIGELFGKGLILKGKAKILGKGESVNNYVSVKDLADVIAHLILDKPKNQRIEIGGPDNMSKKQIANIYAKHLLIEPKISYIPITILKLMSNLLYPFHKGISRVIKMTIHNDSYSNAMHNLQLFEKYSIQPMSTEKFIELHIKSVRKVI